MSQFLDVTARFWEELISRPSGPLAFRFILQPVMAGLLAIRDGYKDASNNRSPYLWTILHDPLRRADRLHEGIQAVARVLLLGIGMEFAYQLFVLKGFRPIELVVIVFLLAFLPYLMLRGPAARVSRHLIERKAREHHRPLSHS
jgi:hypothetical protein